MTLLTRKKQLAAVTQTGTAIPSGLDDAANAAIIALDLASNIDVERIERQLLRSTISSVQDLPGQKAVDVTFAVEMKGTVDGLHGTGAPGWSRYLQACGFREVEMQQIALTGAITASGSPGDSTTFRHGELVVQNTTTARGLVMGDHHDGAPFLRTSVIVDGDAAPDASSPWVGQDSGATVTPTAVPVDAGFAWHPITDPVKTINVDATWVEDVNLFVGDVIEGETSGAVGVMETAATKGTAQSLRFRPLRGTFVDGEDIYRISPTTAATATVTAATPVLDVFVDWAPLAIRTRLDGKSITVGGCRGSVAFNLEVNRPGRMDFTFRGVLSDLTDRALIDAVQYDIGNPPLWENSAIGWARNDVQTEMQLADEVTPCLNTLSFDLGVQLAERKCAGAANGLLEIRGSARDATGSMDPEDSFEADTGWLTAVENGAVYRLSTTVGSDDGNRFELRAPGIQVTAGGEGDRDGTATQDLSLRLSGGNLFDLNTPGGASLVSAIGGNNEVVLLYFTA